MGGHGATASRPPSRGTTGHILAGDRLDLLYHNHGGPDASFFLTKGKLLTKEGN